MKLIPTLTLFLLTTLSTFATSIAPNQMLQYERLAERLDVRLQEHIMKLPDGARSEITERVFQRLDILSSQNLWESNMYVFTHLRDIFFARNLMYSSEELYTVINIVDGDTIDVSDGIEGFRIRLLWLDTPERGECYFSEASDSLEQLILGREVILAKDSTQDERDIFWRELRYIFLPDWKFVNAWIVREWLWVEYTFRNNPHYFQRYFRDAETLASTQNLGKWKRGVCDNQALESQEEEISVRTSWDIITHETWFYTSSHHTSRLYYCASDSSWQSLSPRNLRYFETETELLEVYPSKRLSKPCD